MTTCRLIFDSALDGAWNMAVDEVLLESASLHGDVTLRFYSWSAPTLTLGYFQSYADRAFHSASAECGVVRRCSGGGAIVHDHELTYSFATPCTDRFLAKPEQLYFAFHETLTELLGRQQIPARLHRGKAAPGEAPFLCFQRRAEGDVVVGGEKVAGSAQRRRHAALLQHGSVLLERSSQAPELPGLSELAGFDAGGQWLAETWSELLARRLNLSFERSLLSAQECESACDYRDGRFGDGSWTRRR